MKSYVLRLMLCALNTCAMIAILAPGLSAQTEQILFSFGPVDEGTPYADLAADGKGNLYGTTGNGGEFS